MSEFAQRAQAKAERRLVRVAKELTTTLARVGVITDPVTLLRDAARSADGSATLDRDQGILRWREHG